MSFRPFKKQRCIGSTAEHCCVPLCEASAKYNTVLSFHTFPVDQDLRKTWIVNIRRDSFAITNHTRVCSRHFLQEDLIEPSKTNGRRRLRKGAVPVLFQWNNYSVPVSRPSVWQRRKRPSDEPLGEEEPVEENHLFDHDYCAVPDPAALDLALQQADELREEVERLRCQVEDLSVRQRFCLRRFASSDEDIRFYTRFATYNHLMAFWSLIEPSTGKMLRITRARAASKKNKDIIPCPATQSLQPIDEFFLFMNYLSLGLKQRDLAHRFNISQSTVSRILVTWANYLYTVLGAVCIWMSQKAVKAHLPEEFKDYADTQVILDCTELRCQTPSSLLLQSEVFSSYKSHCTFKGLVGMAPHGAVTFVSALYAGSISNKQILKESGIVQLLTPEMAIMVDRGFLADDCVPCKVHRPAFLSSRSQMPASEVRETQSVARLRVHVERLIRRVKQHKLFDTVIPLSITGTINQFYTVACLLVNYQNGPLVKEWAKGQ